MDIVANSNVAPSTSVELSLRDEDLLVSRLDDELEILRWEDELEKCCREWNRLARGDVG